MAIAAAAVGALVAGGASYASGKASADQAARAYRTRYQTQVKDLKKAGLNPMLSLGLPAPVPQTPQYPNLGESMTRGASAGMQASINAATKENIEADTQLKGTASAVNIANARESSIRAGIQEASLPWAPNLAASTALAADRHTAVQLGQIQQMAAQTEGINLSNKQLEKIQPMLLKAQDLANKGAEADLIEKEVNSMWYDEFGASDKYGPVLKFIVGMIQQMTKVK